MKEVIGDIWSFFAHGYPIVITTNGIVNRRHQNIMGAGIALAAKERFPKLPELIGRHIENQGNTVGYYSQYDIYSFPTKNHWRENSDIMLIERSAKDLLALVDQQGQTKIAMVRPGVNNGRLKWAVVKPVLESILDDRFTVVTYDN